MSFFTSFLPEVGKGGGCFGSPGALNSGDVLGSIGGVFTSHPVQSGANISDHAYREPTRITMEIIMSDVMACRQPGQFNSFFDKSVSAYRRLLDLQRSRIPVSVTTRLGTYKNMLIESVSAPDDVNTRDGLRCSVSMREVLVAKLGVTKVSARAWTTGTGTNKGEVPATTPTSDLRQIEIMAGKK